MASSTSPDGERPEAWMGHLEESFARRGAGIIRDLLRDAGALLHPDGALRATQGLGLQQIMDLKTLVRQHYTCHIFPDYRLAFWGIDPEQVWRWRGAGVLGPTAAWDLGELLQDAVTAARVAELLDTGASYRQMLRLALERPMSRVEELARQIARERTWVALDALAWRHADALGREVLDARQREVGALVSDFIAGTLTNHGRAVQGNRALATALRDRFKARDIERDWLRVAVTETNWATNYASLVMYQEQGVERIYFVVQPGACEECRKTYLHEDGTPKIFLLADILEEVALNGGTNIGRPKKDWVPTALLHPWCRCRPARYIKGLPFAPTGGRS